MKDKCLPGVRKNATLENRRAGVNSDTFRWFICFKKKHTLVIKTGMNWRGGGKVHLLCLFIKYSMSSEYIPRRTYQNHLDNRLRDNQGC